MPSILMRLVRSFSLTLKSDNEYEDGTPFMPTIIGRETSPSTVDTFSIGGNTPSTTGYILAKTRMGIFSVCAELKARRAKLCGHERDLVTSALQEHREQQACERQKLYKHRKKCYDSPHKYMGLIIDGMDQKKTVLPHFARIPKNMKEENFIQMHLVGCLVFNGHIIPKLDNTSRENKNQVVLAYLNILVELENIGMPPNLLTSHVEAREMYIGARKSHARHKDIYSGSVQDIKVGSMIVVLATNCEHGHLFWIAKVLNLIYKDDEINAIEVHWYSTKTNSLKGVYNPEMIIVEDRKKKRKRKCTIARRRIDMLFLDSVDILVYDFTLTKRHQLRKTTIDIIKQKLPQVTTVEQDEYRCRSQRLSPCNLMGLKVDSDGALVDSAEEDGSSTSVSKNSYEETPDSDGVSLDDDM
eukprot:Gb_02275 [translate_table: standard]